MSTMAQTATITTIEPGELAERIASGDAPPILDVRDPQRFAAWRISAPGRALDVRNLPWNEAVARADELAEQVEPGTVVVCNVGQTASVVAEELLRRGVVAPVLRGGMDAWIGAYHGAPVELGVDGLEVVQVQRVGRGCFSYLVAAGGEALVVDPGPDPVVYERAAAAANARIVGVLDTHLHADHLSGARDLAARTGARLHLSRGALERGVSFAGDVSPVEDGDALDVGGVSVRALSLPGHTTDMTGLVVAGRALIGGDSLFADAVARPDLEVGEADASLDMARRLHRTIHGRILALGDDVRLLPGHYGGGVLPGAVAPTLGEVRARLPELALDEEAFARRTVEAMPERPANYLAIIEANRGYGPAAPTLEAGANNCAASSS